MNIPADTPLGFIGGILILLGILLALGGAGIIRVKNISIEQGKKTFIVGIFLLICGTGALWTEVAPLFFSTEEVASEIPLKQSLSQKTPTPAAQAEQVRELQGFHVTLQECKREMENVTCYLQIISQEQDRSLRLHVSRNHWSKLFDEAGNEYWASHGQIADKTGTDFFDGFLIANLPTKAMITFANVKPEAKLITLLIISLSFNIEYRNIPISE